MKFIYWLAGFGFGFPTGMTFGVGWVVVHKLISLTDVAHVFVK